MKISTSIAKVFSIVFCLLLMCSTLFSVKYNTTTDLQLGKKVFESGTIELTFNNFIPGKEPMVFLIGENHVNVETQTQLSSLLADLYQAKAIDAILIEGAYGPVEVEQFAKKMTRESSKPVKKLREFWQKQLQWGKISGFEYFALTNPGLEIFGVEDMGEKAKYNAKINAYSKGNFNFEIESNRRGVELIEKAIASLKGIASQKGLHRARRELEELKSTISDFEKVLENIFRQYTPLGQLIQQQIEISIKYTSLNKKIEKPLREARKWQKRYEEIESQLQKKYVINLFIEKSELGMKLDNFINRYRSELENLNSLETQYEEKDRELDPLFKKFEPSIQELAKFRARVEDHFFIVFNLMTTIGDSCGKDFRKIKTFFADEADRMKKDRRKNWKKELLPRDRAMVQNTIDYLNRTGKSTALIVGYAHLEGVAEQFKEWGISFIAGKLKACEKDSEHWEVTAWGERKKRHFKLFSSGVEKKERTLLLNRSWKEDQLKMQKYFYNYSLENVEPNLLVTGLVGDSKIFKLKGQGDKIDRTIQIGKFPIDRNAEVGEHIVARGPVPYKADVFFEIVDRNIAKSLVEKYSDNSTSFVFYRQGADQLGKETYMITTPMGEQLLKVFLKAPPQKPGKNIPRRVVMFGEADEVQEGILATSKLWKQIRQGGGGNHLPPHIRHGQNNAGKSGGRWTSLWFLAGTKRKTKSPALYRTINPRRAQENLKKLDRQDPKNFGDILFLEEKDLYELPKKLKFTPRKGDHAQMILIVARNIAEFRDAIKKAAKNRLLKNKQVGLIMCGDLFAETAQLRETLLREGALMVWHPDRQISPEAAKRLKQEIQTLGRKLKTGERPQTIDELIYKAIENWQKKETNSFDLKSFELSSTYVINFQKHGIIIYKALG